MQDEWLPCIYISISSCFSDLSNSFYALLDNKLSRISLSEIVNDHYWTNVCFVSNNNDKV